MKISIRGLRKLIREQVVSVLDEAVEGVPEDVRVIADNTVKELGAIMNIEKRVAYVTEHARDLALVVGWFISDALPEMRDALERMLVHSDEKLQSLLLHLKTGKPWDRADVVAYSVCKAIA